VNRDIVEIGIEKEKSQIELESIQKARLSVNWLLSKNRDMDNVFKKSFNAINDYTGDFDLALWYLAFSQSLN